MAAARRAFASGDLATAERICSEVLARAPDDGAAWALLTETALQRGRPDAAIVCANRAVARMPKDPIAHILRAKCPVSYTHLRAHETRHDLVCRLLLEKKKNNKTSSRCHHPPIIKKT